MNINIKDEKLDETLAKNMSKRKSQFKTKTQYIRWLINRDANDLGLIKVEDLI